MINHHHPINTINFHFDKHIYIYTFLTNTCALYVFSFFFVSFFLLTFGAARCMVFMCILGLFRSYWDSVWTLHIWWIIETNHIRLADIFLTQFNTQQFHVCGNVSLKYGFYILKRLCLMLLFNTKIYDTF